MGQIQFEFIFTTCVMANTCIFFLLLLPDHPKQAIPELSLNFMAYSINQKNAGIVKVLSISASDFFKSGN